MKQSLKNHFATVKQYIIKHNEQVIGVAIVAGLALIIVAIAAIVQLSGPRIVYQPVKSCDLFTPAEAQSLLGERVIAVDSKAPEINENVAMSKCSYTDDNPDQAQMLVAAVAVQSAINDEGIIKNVENFAKARSNNKTDTVTGIGESAFFNKTNGQLHILNQKNWIIVSYGIGSNPTANTPEKATELAKLILN